MSTSIHLAKGLSLPLHIVTESVAMLAKRRAGKSTTARRLAEQLHQAKQQVVIADPKGDWWGLLFARDGKSPGLPFIVLGGEHGHIQLEVGAGELVARMVVAERVSLVLDLSAFRKHEVATFMTAFMETLYRLKAQEQYRTPLMLVIDEADAIAPQKPQRGEERMLGAAEDLVRRGGQRGIGVTMITQRSAVLNKNVLTQIGILIVLRTIAPQDLAAMDAWIDVHGTVEQRKALMDSLPSLPVGTGWVWAPGWPDAGGIFEKRAFLLPETFDSSRTPTGEKTFVPKNAADVDLAAFEREMAATIERQKQEDPKLARAEIARLNAQVKRLTGELEAEKAKKPAGKEKRVEVPVLKDAQIDKLHHLSTMLCERANNLVAPLQKIADRLTATSKEIADAVHQTTVHAGRLPGSGGLPATPRGLGGSRPGSADQVRRPVAPSRGRRDAPVRVDADGDLTVPEKRILDGVAWWESAGIPQPSRHQAAFGARYSVNGHFNNIVGGLRTKGLLDYPKGDHVALTDEGRKVAVAPDIPPDRTGLIDMVRQVLRQEPQRRVFDTMVRAGLDVTLSREQLAEGSGYSVNGHFNNIVGGLNSLGVFRYPRGNCVALGEMFEGVPS